MKILAINTGSSSLKFRLQDVEVRPGASPSEIPVADGEVRSIGISAHGRLRIRGEKVFDDKVDAENHRMATTRILAWLKDRNLQVEGVGHRVVHGGKTFTRSVRIDDHDIEAIASLGKLAPLHNPVAHEAILATRQALGSSVPMVAVFDTAFHRTMPEAAASYAIPPDLAERHAIARYGFHGIAHGYMMSRYAEIKGKPPEDFRLITLQLGHGSSAAAIREGRSVDTSMGFTPLEGLIMATRSGDIDPAVVAYLAEQERVDPATVVEWLNRRSGLLGISGSTANMRELLEREASDPRARLAVDAYCYRIRKYVGAYLAVLGGADAVIFSGGIGENAPAVREKILDPMAWSGMTIDPESNRRSVGVEGLISIKGASPEVYIIPMNEEATIIGETARCLEEQG